MSNLLTGEDDPGLKHKPGEDEGIEEKEERSKEDGDVWVTWLRLNSLGLGSKRSPRIISDHSPDVPLR